jgi:RNA polymerase sigma-70 factor, ECF subfamily
LEPVPDRDLTLRLQRGDLDALGEIYDRHQRLVYRTALAITNDEDAAADLLQDVFLRFHRFVERVDVSRPLEPWLYRVTTNLAYTWVKRRQRWWRSLKTMGEWLMRETRPSPQMIAEQHEEWQRISCAVEELPPSQRMVVVLYYINDFSLNEISDTLDIPVGTVKSRLHYGRKALKKELGQTTDLQPEVRYELS